MIRYDFNRLKMRILVLDDDSFMLEFITHLLKELGVSEVLVAGNGRGGLHVLAGHEGVIDALICDIEMSGMDGIEFLRNLADQNYRGKIVLFSGVDDGLLKAAERLAIARGLNVVGTLNKPVTLGAMADILEQMAKPSLEIQDSDKIKQVFDVSEIEQALLTDRIDIYYQPKISAVTGHVTGVECLARWRHPQYGLILPDNFVPVIEQTGLIGDFTRYVLRKSSLQLGLWLRQGMDLKISVNVSMENLDRFNLPEIYEQAVRECDVPIERVMLEITENKLGKDFAQTLDILTRIRLKGFGLAIDDFGKGYSSMETLKHMPFNELKVDRLFAHGAATDSATRAILESSIKLGRVLNLNVVVEGIETEADFRLAVELGCDEIQGYFIARPMPAGDFIEWFIAHEAISDGSH